MTKATAKIYQFKISLKGIRPPIWRRVLVPANYTFKELHDVIQNAMGWYDCHLHQFEIKNFKGRIIIGTEEFDEYDDCDEFEHKVKLSKYFKLPKDKATYEYDFGDGWEHEIILEKVLPVAAEESYPKCIAGKRACPPEDCGGVWGYEELLEIINDPDHEEYEERKEWLDEEFDAEKFDKDEIDFDKEKMF